MRHGLDELLIYQNHEWLLTTSVEIPWVGRWRAGLGDFLLEGHREEAFVLQSLANTRNIHDHLAPSVFQELLDLCGAEVQTGHTAEKVTIALIKEERSSCG